MANMKNVLNNFVTYLVDHHARWYSTDDYDDILYIEGLEDDREEIIKDFLFKEFPNFYPNEINFRIRGY